MYLVKGVQLGITARISWCPKGLLLIVSISAAFDIANGKDEGDKKIIIVFTQDLVRFSLWPSPQDLIDLSSRFSVSTSYYSPKTGV